MNQIRHKIPARAKLSRAFVDWWENEKAPAYTNVDHSLKDAVYGLLREGFEQGVKYGATTVRPEDDQKLREVAKRIMLELEQNASCMAGRAHDGGSVIGELLFEKEEMELMAKDIQRQSDELKDALDDLFPDD